MRRKMSGMRSDREGAHDDDDASSTTTSTTKSKKSSDGLAAVPTGPMTMTKSRTSSSSTGTKRIARLILLLATVPSPSRSLSLAGGGRRPSSSFSASARWRTAPPAFSTTFSSSSSRRRRLLLRAASSASSSSSSSDRVDDDDGAPSSSSSSSLCDAGGGGRRRRDDDAASSTSSTVVVVDAENVRGATSFRVGHGALLSRVRLWREDRSSSSLSSSSSSSRGGSLEPLIWVCDHGDRPSVHHFPSSSGIVGNDAVGGRGGGMPRDFGVAFAGPGRTADDVIVDIVGLRCGCDAVYDDGGGGGGRDAFDVDVDDDVGDFDIVDDHDAHDYDDDEDEGDPGRRLRTAAGPSRNTTVVITADARLISRCQRARRMGRSPSDVVFVEPASLLRQLERYRTDAAEEGSYLGGEGADAIGPKTTTAAAARTRRPPTPSTGVGRDADGKTATMTSFKDSTIAMQQHAKFQARFGKLGSDATQTSLTKIIDSGADNYEEEEEEEEEDDDGVNDDDNYDDEDDDEEGESQATDDSNAAALAAQLKTEQIRRHLLLSDAYYLARPSKNVRGRRAHTTSAAVHAKYKDRKISITQQKKLYARRFGDRRKEDMVLAASKRKEDAGRLQRILDRASGYDREDGRVAGLQAPSTTLLQTLLRKFERETAIRFSGALDDSVDGGPLPAFSSRDSATVPGLDRTAGRVSPDDRLDPLGSILKVPLRSDTATNDSDLFPLRIVVISDTHGFEGALARFVDTPDGAGSSPESRHLRIHGDDFLLPQADVLLHCGDFAASGSRKNQRAAARRLDDFLARQTHIPEKIVVQGNHDPDSPAKVLFPNSKALYVRSSSTLMINGVSFTLEPYSRRMSFRSIRNRMSPSVPSLPACDILVSHEPPKGILDMTYHGFSAGSAYLRELVEHAEHKPRLWLCGHIHESRGVISKHFHPERGHIDDIDASTMVINASNANSGKANRLVSGAVLVDIERRPSDTWGEESAENTLRSRRIDHDDFFLDSADRSDDLARLGEELELYTTRPGVRRRKGVPRRQMEIVRSTLVPSEK